jgi:hypothetical protein
MRTIWKRTFKLRVAFNMAVCALLLGAFGSLPRETISGFLGRKYLSAARWGEASVWVVLARLVDALHPWEKRHCARVAREEHAGWLAMYPERYR